MFSSLFEFAVRRSCWLFGLAAAALLAGPCLGADDYVEGEALVKFRPAAAAPATEKMLQDRALSVAKTFSWLSSRRQQRYALVRSGSRTTADLLADLRQDPSVEAAEPNYRRRVSGGLLPNDPSFSKLWALHNTGQAVMGLTGTPDADIDFPEAWDLARPATSGVVIAVIDTGVNYTHPDLAPSMWRNPGENPTNGVDDDGNGYVDDYYGYDFAGDGVTGSSDSDPMDILDHGTHVCGTIAAAGNNREGIVGVNFTARIMALKASTDGVTVDDAATVEALEYAAMMKGRGVNIASINASYGSTSFNSIERDAIAEAAAAGIVFCAAAGNDARNNDTTPTYPAGYEVSNIIAVAATDNRDALASFSNYGATSVDLAAPGNDIYSCRPVYLAGSLAYVQTTSATYQASALGFAGNTTGITAAAYYCGLGYATSFPPVVRGRIALIERGTLLFAEKVSNAMAAGARAAVIYNNVIGAIDDWGLQYPRDWIPAVGITRADGQALVALGVPRVTVMSLYDTAFIYQYMDGTSMATPHVAGAVAFAAANFPAENVTQRVQRVLSTVDVLPGLAGKVRTGGRLNLARLVDTDGDQLPDWWEQTCFGNLTHAAAEDSDQDGASNMEEWQAGTMPTTNASVLRILTAPRPATNGTAVSWQSVTGKYYRIERSTNLAVSFDCAVRTNILATPPTNQASDASGPIPGPSFYRVILEP